jgi:hypothetical protein
MYEVPSRDDVAKVVINRDTVLDNVNPTLVPREHPGPKRDRRERSAYGPESETYPVHAAALLMRDVVTAAAFHDTLRR